MKAEFVVGYDRRERLAWNIAVRSLLKHSNLPYPIRPISIEHLGELYRRPTERVNGRLWDTISQAPMSTSFALARFWTPYNAKTEWSIFMDGDFLIRHDIDDLIGQLDSKYGLMCVQHQFAPSEDVKMDGQKQTSYPRKCWSSLMAFNNCHEATRRLLRGQHNNLGGINLNISPGLELQKLHWLHDEEIGALDPSWNWLDNNTEGDNPKAVHFTRGCPDMGIESKYAKEWWGYGQ